MKSPFEQLGLPEHADERMVKRAYAQRLRDTRPDSDPEGFQRLHAIYQAALAQCQRQTPAAAAHREPWQESAMPAQETPVATPNSPKEVSAFSFGRFSTELLALAALGDATQLKAWLEEQPDLWSLRMKSQIGRELFTRLHREVPPMSPACIEVLLVFFDANHTRPGHDTLRLQQTLRRMQLAWELLPSHRDALAGRMDIERCGLELNLERLAHPLRLAQVLRIGLEPYEASSYVQFIQRLSLNHPEDLPETCDQNQIRFWLQATEQRRVSKERLQLGAIRCAAILLSGLLLGLLCGGLMRTPSDHFNWLTLWMCIGVPAVPTACWALYMLVSPLDGWHAKPEYEPAHWPWLNLFLVPMLCATALVSAKADAYVAALLPALAALWLALRRLWRRNTASLHLSPRLIWVSLWAVFMLVRSLLKDTDWAYDGTAYPVFTAAAAMLIWGIDLWRQRHGLRVRHGMQS